MGERGQLNIILGLVGFFMIIMIVVLTLKFLGVFEGGITGSFIITSNEDTILGPFNVTPILFEYVNEPTQLSDENGLMKMTVGLSHNQTGITYFPSVKTQIKNDEKSETKELEECFETQMRLPPKPFGSNAFSGPEVQYDCTIPIYYDCNGQVLVNLGEHDTETDNFETLRRVFSSVTKSGTSYCPLKPEYIEIKEHEVSFDYDNPRIAITFRNRFGEKTVNLKVKAIVNVSTESGEEYEERLICEPEEQTYNNVFFAEHQVLVKTCELKKENIPYSLIQTINGGIKIEIWDTDTSVTEPLDVEDAVIANPENTDLRYAIAFKDVEIVQNSFHLTKNDFYDAVFNFDVINKGELIETVTYSILSKFITDPNEVNTPVPHTWQPSCEGSFQINPNQIKNIQCINDTRTFFDCTEEEACVYVQEERTHKIEIFVNDQLADYFEPNMKAELLVNNFLTPKKHTTIILEVETK